MLIDFKDIQVGDEVIISSFSQLKYLKVRKLGVKSHICRYQKDVYITPGGIGYRKPAMCENDISKHNATFYLQNDWYRDIWLVKRENN